MTDHNLVRWLNYQTKKEVGLINFETISQGSDKIKQKIISLKKDGIKYAIVDTTNNKEFDVICEWYKRFTFSNWGIWNSTWSSKNL